MFLPAEYVGSESERLTLYRRLASVSSNDELADLVSEMRDRFGPLPVQVQNLVTSVETKLLAVEARANTVRLDRETLVIKTEPSGIFDRVSLYRKYGGDARIANNMLRLPRRLLGSEPVAAVREILSDMASLRASFGQKKAVTTT
jgi:transcription-repair coupling factor (superfamily II helicase)